ncbi:MAG: hypothetical protein GYB42_00450 [Alphaproteobacteria bacterium]|nr:hypothetical protein [Alphaproteobacteria bacterium]
MSQAQPAIAITGRGCVLPGALSPQALWDAVIHHRDLTRPMTHLDLEMTPDEALAGGFRGGAIDGFGPYLESLQGALPHLALETLDPVFTWTLQAAPRGRPGSWGAVGEAETHGPHPRKPVLSNARENPPGRRVCADRRV